MNDRAVSFFIGLLAILVVVVVSTTLAWVLLRDDPPPHEKPRERPRTIQALEPNLAELPATEALVTYLSDIREQSALEVGAYIAAVQQAELDAFLASLYTPPPPAVRVPATPAAGGAVSSGARSYAWWEAIATCESGNTNAWRTGYYGLEAGYPIGHMSKADQLAWAERIYANHGDGAWGCSPVAWQNVPGG